MATEYSVAIDVLVLKAPGHQYPQCMSNIHCIGPAQEKNITYIMNIRKENLENIMQLLMGNFFFNHCTF